MCTNTICGTKTGQQLLYVLALCSLMCNVGLGVRIDLLHACTTKVTYIHQHATQPTYQNAVHVKRLASMMVIQQAYLCSDLMLLNRTGHNLQSNRDVATLRCKLLSHAGLFLELGAHTTKQLLSLFLGQGLQL